MKRQQLVAEQADLFAQCQRWRAGRASYRPAGEVFDTSRAHVEPIDEAPAKAFTLAHHYAGSFPAARCSVGLFVKRSAFARETLSGVAVFSVGMNPASVPAWFPGTDPARGVELGRFCLLDECAANAETWFQARALRWASQLLPNLDVVLSYCDPVARTALDGSTVFPGHLGTIYSAGNARRLGRATPRTLKLLPDGRVASERALSKLRTDDQGAAYALAQLVQAGAPRRSPGESGAAYLARLDAAGFFRRLRHQGNLVFGWDLRKHAKAAAHGRRV